MTASKDNGKSVGRKAASERDIQKVFNKLSSRSKEEIADFDYTPLRAKKLILEDYKCRGAEAITLDGEPVALIGTTIRGEGLETWFMSKAEYWLPSSPQRQFLYQARRIIRDFCDQFPLTPIVTHSKSRHADTTRWFRWLGFEQEGPDRLEENGSTYRKFIINHRSRK